MTENNSASLQSLLQFALPLGTQLVTGNAEAAITWAVMVQAQPPAFPDVYGGELALVSLDVLRSYDSRVTLADLVRQLGPAGVIAIAVKEDIPQSAVTAAADQGVALLALPADSSMPRIERAVNTLIVNQKAQITQRALEIQRQLTRLAAENRDLNSLLSLISRATAKPAVIHDDAGVLMAQVYPNVARRAGVQSSRNLVQSLPYGAFQSWLNRDAPNVEGAIARSPLGYTTVMRVEKRVAGYLSLVDTHDVLDEFDRMILGYGADVCAVELAKNRAIAFAVEQARGDWIQMWLSGTASDDDMLMARAQQSGFEADTPFVAAVYRAASAGGVALPLDALVPLVRDDLARRQVAGVVGQFVDMMVALYPVENQAAMPRLKRLIEDTRVQLASRTPSGRVSAGISRPVQGLRGLRDAHREAKDAVSIANEIGEREQTTFYGDLKLYQLLLAFKDRNLDQMRRFYEEILAPLVEHDGRKQGDLIRTLAGFFDANGNLAKAASDLDVHRNTLVYRLDRISELTGLNLEDADNRLILHIALKIQRVLATLPGN